MPLTPLSSLPASDAIEFVNEKKSVLRKSATVGAYKLGDVVGSGGFGQVRLATVKDMDDSFKVAIKTLTRVDANTSAALRQEVEMQIAVHDHPNIPTCFDLFHTKSNTYLAMEYAPNGDLFDFISVNGPLTFRSVSKIMKQLCSVVAHMHSKNIAHRDIKPENVLLTNNNSRALLCDFGHAVEWKEEDGLLHKSCGTARCLPPEMFLVDDVDGKRHYNPKCVDVFELGNLMYYLLTGRFAFEGADRNETARNIVNGKYTTPLPVDTPKECVDMVMELLNPDDHTRISAAKALKHPFLSAPPRDGSH